MTPPQVPPVPPPAAPPPPQIATHQGSGRVFAKRKDTGELVSLTPEDYAAYADQYDPAERQEVVGKLEPVRRDQLLRQSIGPMDAVGKGLERAFTLGLSDAPEFHEADYGEYLKALEDEYPITLAGSELAGLVGQSAMGVGLPGAADKLGSAVKGALAGETRAMRLLGGAAGGAAEAAMYGPGGAARDATIKNEPLTTDLIVAHTGGMALVGAMLGGPLSLVGRKGAKKALEETENALKPGAELTGPEMAGYIESRYKDGADPGILNKLRSVRGGGSPEIYAALERDPELRQYLIPEVRAKWLDDNARQLAQDMTPTAQALESAQVHTGKFKYENAIPHLDAITAERAAQSAAKKLDEIEELVTNQLNDPSYKQVVEKELGTPEMRRAFGVRNRMDDTYEALRATDLDEELNQLRIKKNRADFTKMMSDTAKAKNPERQEQLKASLGILDNKFRQLQEQGASFGPLRKRYEDELKLFERELGEMQQAGVETKSVAMEGNSELRRYGAKIRRARARIAAAAEDGPVEQAARGFSELDSLKSAAGQKAKPGTVLNRWDDVPEVFRRANDDLRVHLEDSGTWGSRLAKMQSDVNAPFHRQLNVLRDVADKYFTRSGQDSVFTTWKQGEIADPAGFTSLLGNLTNAKSDVELMKLRQYLESSIDTSKAIRTHYTALPEMEVKRLLDSEAAATRALGTLDKVSREASKMNQIGHISSHHDEALRAVRNGALLMGGIFGGPVGAGVGWVAGHKVMNLLNPVPRLTMLARAEALNEIHSTWQMDLVKKILGGKGPGRPPKVTGVPKPKARAYVKMKVPVTGALLYDWMSEPEDKKDKQKSAQRFVDHMKVVADGGNTDFVKKSVGDMLGVFGQENPGITAAMEKKAKAAAKAIVRNAPTREVPPDALFPKLWTGGWSSTEYRKLEQAVEAALDPNSTMERIPSGMVTPEQIKILTEVSPDLIAGLCRQLVESVHSDHPPDARIRRQLSIVLGLPTDPTTSPEFVAMSQENYAKREEAYAKTEKKGGGGGRTFGATGVNIGSSVSTSLSKLEQGEHPR